MNRRIKLKTPADVQHEFFMDVMDYMDGLIGMDELEAKYSDGSDYWKRMQDEHSIHRTRKQHSLGRGRVGRFRK